VEVVLGFLFEENVMTPLTVGTPVHPTILRIQSLLRKIDHLILPPPSRRDVESILVRQASKEIDRALPWQAGHGRRTAAIALDIGRALNMDADALHHLKLAALLHDIGLLMLPERLTTGRGPLEPASYEAVQNHPRLGAALLEPFRFLNEAAVLVAHHHERWDGFGYPYGIRGPFIPLGARILSVADVFDALEIPGVDSAPIRNRVAYRILRVAAGTQFDPSIVAQLGDVLEKSILGSGMGRTTNDQPA
jgi:HD-GYP domain-containing protein (c-di-GMP phosphodiesterase class II)